MWQIENLEKTLAWARYLFWADMSRQRLDDCVTDLHLSDNLENKWQFFALLSQFLAAAYVVVEGWCDAKLHDPVIDQALHRWSDVTRLLRIYRNGVFHYQPKLMEERFLKMLEDYERSTFWVRYLHSEFLRYYWSYVNEFPGTPEQRSDFRDSVFEIVGWIPEDIIEAKALRLRKIAAHAERMIVGDMSEGADELRTLAKEARHIANKQVETYRRQCRDFLAKTAKSNSQVTCSSNNGKTPRRDKVKPSCR